MENYDLLNMIARSLGN